MKLAAPGANSAAGMANPSVTAQDPAEKLQYLAMLDPLGAPCDAHNYEVGSPVVNK